MPIPAQCGHDRDRLPVIELRLVQVGALYHPDRGVSAGGEPFDKGQRQDGVGHHPVLVVADVHGRVRLDHNREIGFRFSS